MLDGDPVTVIGVMPAGFEFPFDAEDPTDVWMPVMASRFAAQWADQRGASFLNAIGRLRPGVERPAAQAELTAVAARIAAGEPARQRERRPRSSVPGRARRRLPPGARRPALGRRGSAADRVRERRKPAARARNGPPPGDRRPHRARREPRPDRAPVPERRARAGGARRRGRHGRRPLGPRGARAHQSRADPAAARGADRSQRSRLHGARIDADGYPVRRGAGVPAVAVRSRRRAERRRSRRQRRARRAHAADPGGRRSCALAGAARRGRPARSQPDRPAARQPRLRDRTRAS